jgi:phage baseplate assembly protein W
MDGSSNGFIGTGWKFPVTFKLGNAAVDLISGEENITNSLTVLFSTVMGERIMHPDYGSELESFIFMPMSTSTITYMQVVITKAVLFNEPRIVLNNVEVKTRKEDPACLEINIDYTISETNNRYNFVYPFYLKEATNLSK